VRALVTGCAGFIGSAIVDRLIKNGATVIGIDCFTNYYPRSIKESNLSIALKSDSFELIEKDINSIDRFPDVDYVFHLAAQAGVRSSWGSSFDIYTRNNIEATQKLLESYKQRRLKKFVYSSSSSVYGNVKLPMTEDSLLKPVSPYGVSKLAGEHLCYLYWKNYQIPTVSLRYFTVYGPHQRPDMAIHKFIRAILTGDKITIYGKGDQTRDFTYVDDVVEANMLSAFKAYPGSLYNIGGGNRIAVNDLITLLEELTGEKALVERIESQKGDVDDTWASVEKARTELGWASRVDLRKGLMNEIEWIKSIL
jgi:UDP-glucose 4-epimerase